MAQSDKKNTVSNRKVAQLGRTILALFGLGLVFHEKLWAFHYPAFLPIVATVLVFLLALLLVHTPHFYDWDKIGQRLEGLKWNRFLPYGIAMVMGILYWMLPIAMDLYGDAAEITRQLDARFTAFDPQMLKDALLPVFDLKTGTISFYGIVGLFAYLFDANGLDTLFALEAVLGATFVLLWLRLVRELMVSSVGRIVMGLIGLTSPALLIYFGHVEIYAFPMTFNLAFVTSLVLFFRTQKRWYFWMLLPLLYFCIQFSITGILLIPIYLLAIIFYIWTMKKGAAKFWTWKQIFLYMLLPASLTGIFVYVFVTESVYGGRFYTVETLDKVIFLPVMTPEEAPLDRYNLFSFAHLWDYFNLWFVWSAPGVFIAAVAGTRIRRQINWSAPELQVVATGFLIYFMFFFVLNPLLGMASDWDLMSLPAPLFLVMVLLIASQIEKLGFFSKLVGGSVAFCLLSMTTFWVNSQPEPLSRRLEVVGSQNFQTSYIGAITSWKGALDMETDTEKEIQRIKDLLSVNYTFVVKGNDPEYAYLHWRLGGIFENEKKDLPLAIEQYEAAREAAPFFGINLNHLVGACYYAGEYEKADLYAEDMIRFPYPNLPTALRAGVQVAVEAQNWERASSRVTSLLEIEPGDQLFREVKRRLDQQDRLGTIKDLLK